MNDQVLERLKNSAAIPSMPQVVCRFLEIVRDPIFSYEDLVDLLSADPGLTGDVLRMANCSFFGVTRKITGVHQALTLLGIRRIRSLVVGRYMVQSISQDRQGNILTDDYWRRSVGSAVIAAKFAACRAPHLAEEAMIAGLLSDMGVTVLDDGLAEQYASVAANYMTDHPSDYVRREQQDVDTDHSEIGALVLEEWQLPALIFRAARHHHCGSPPKSLSDDQATLARLLRAAGILGWLLTGQPDASEIAPTCTQAAEDLGVSIAELLEILGAIPQYIEELATLLQVQVVPASNCETICRELSAILEQPNHSSTAAVS